MNIARNPENVAAGLSVPERTLLFSIACGVDWNYNPSITRATVIATVLRGLVERDATGQRALSRKGCTAVRVLFKGG